MKKMILAVIAVAGITACTTTGPAADLTPRETFSRSCAGTAEVMLNVKTAFDAGLVPVDAYRVVYSQYLAAVETCRTLPLTDDAAMVASMKVAQFAAAASVATGKKYDVSGY